MHIFKLAGGFVFVKLSLPRCIIQWRQNTSDRFPLCNGKARFGKPCNAAKQYLYYNHAYAQQQPVGYLPVVLFIYLIHCSGKISEARAVKTTKRFFKPILQIFVQQKMLSPFFDTNLVEAGLDEAGRGCYAGPVYAAAVILPKDFHHPLLNDSKKLSEQQRDLLRPIIEKESIAFAVTAVGNREIDKINILQASYAAMHRCLDNLAVQPELLLIDGNRFKPYKTVRHECIVKGDGKYTAIAAASILAKTHRDEYMQQLHREFPHYGWDRNKGYGTETHRKAIFLHGLCTYHRRSFSIQPTLFSQIQ